MLGEYRKPTMPAKAIRGQRVAGAVSGSVSITKAKNSSGDEPKVSARAVPYCDGSVVAGTSTMRTKTLLVIQQAATTKAVVKASAAGSCGTRFRKLKTKAVPSSAIR